MDKATIRIIIPVELRPEIERISNVRVVALPAPEGIDLSWRDIQNVAAIITITGGLAGLPGQILEIATMLTKYAVSQPSGCVYVIEGDHDNRPIIVKTTDERADLLEALNEGVIWERTN